MKIKVTQDKLSKALTSVSRIAIGKATLPILNNILIRVDNKKSRTKVRLFIEISND